MTPEQLFPKAVSWTEPHKHTNKLLFALFFLPLFLFLIFIFSTILDTTFFSDAIHYLFFAIHYFVVLYFFTGYRFFIFVLTELKHTFQTFTQTQLFCLHCLIFSSFSLFTKAHTHILSWLTNSLTHIDRQTNTHTHISSHQVYIYRSLLPSTL